MSTHAATTEKPWPMARTPLMILCIVAPLVGAILYYVWRKEHPECAAFANRVSIIAFCGWIALNIVIRVVL